MTLEQLAAQVDSMPGPVSGPTLAMLCDLLNALRPATPFDLEPCFDAAPRYSIREVARDNDLRCRYDRIRLWNRIKIRLRALE